MTTRPAGSERRRHERIILPSPIRARFAGEDVQILDVSEGGMLVQASVWIAPGSISPIVVPLRTPLSASIRILHGRRIATARESSVLLNTAFTDPQSPQARRLVTELIARPATSR